MSLRVKVTMRSRITLCEKGMPTGEESASALISAEGYFSPDSGRLSYTERGEGGETEVMLSFPPARDSLTVRRNGASEACFTLKSGTTAVFTYAVPPFSFPAKATLISLSNRLSDRGGTLSAVYRMELGGQEEEISWNILVTPREEDTAVDAG